MRRMSSFAGVDGCKSGWIVIRLEEKNNWDWKLCETIHEVIDYTFQTTLTLIDIPIGLKDDDPEERTCDKAARKRLGYPRMFSVFNIPNRTVVYASSYKDACTLNYSITGKKISIQTWGIIPKIKEVDMVFSQKPHLQNVIRETHPEVCFAGLSGRAMRHSKKTQIGINERLNVLQNIYPLSESVFSTLARNISRKSASHDDILDALAVALSAKLARQKAVILGNNEMDSHRLRMEIVFGVSPESIEGLTAKLSQ